MIIKNTTFYFDKKNVFAVDLLNSLFSIYSFLTIYIVYALLYICYYGQL